MHRDAGRSESSRTGSSRRRRFFLLLGVVALVFVAARGDTQPRQQPPALFPLAVEVIAGLNGLSSGSDPAVGLAAHCLDKAHTVAIVLAALDADGDGALTVQEVVTADLLAIARQVQQRLRCRAPAVELGRDDQPLIELVAYYLSSLRLHFPDDQLPPVPVATMRGDPQGLLREATFRTLADLVASLGTLPQEGDMTGRDKDANDAQKRELLATLDRLFPLVETGLTRPLRRELLALRALADGDAAVPDVITPRAAPRIVFQIDSLLGLPVAR